MNFEISLRTLIYFYFNEIIALPLDVFKELSENELSYEDHHDPDIIHFKNKIYGIPSEAVGKRVAMWRKEDDINPEELGDYTEGDMLIPALGTRSGLKTQFAHWPRGEIPYMISPVFNASERLLILAAMEDLSTKTCLKFHQRTGEESYIRIQSDNTGCWSQVGYTGSRVEVNLQRPACVTKRGTVMHELCHSVGVVHEQGRPDRDESVTIEWKNIQRGAEPNFIKYPKTVVSTFGQQYDYGSVMHYSRTAFSKNGQPTITAKNNFLPLLGDKNRLMGQRRGLSATDVIKLNKMYDCDNYYTGNKKNI